MNPIYDIVSLFLKYPEVPELMYLKKVPFEIQLMEPNYNLISLFFKYPEVRELVLLYQVNPFHSLMDKMEIKLHDSQCYRNNDTISILGDLIYLFNTNYRFSVGDTLICWSMMYNQFDLALYLISLPIPKRLRDHFSYLLAYKNFPYYHEELLSTVVSKANDEINSGITTWESVFYVIRTYSTNGEDIVNAIMLEKNNKLN